MPSELASDRATVRGCFVLNSHFIQLPECTFCLFVCQTACIFYSIAFQILWPEIFFFAQLITERKSSCATHNMIFEEKNPNYFSQMLPVVKIKIHEKNKNMLFKQNREYWET